MGGGKWLYMQNVITGNTWNKPRITNAPVHQICSRIVTCQCVLMSSWLKDVHRVWLFFFFFNDSKCKECGCSMEQSFTSFHTATILSTVTAFLYPLVSSRPVQPRAGFTECVRYCIKHSLFKNGSICLNSAKTDKTRKRQQ